MTAHPFRIIALAVRRGPAAWAGAAAAGTCLLAAGCSAGGPAVTGAGSAGAAARAPSAVAGAHAAANGTVLGPAAPRGTAGQGLSLTALAPPAIIRTASLTVRAGDVVAAAGRATRIAELAGGYVSAEHTALSRGRRVRSTVSIQLKVPAGAYQSTLSALGALGTTLSQSQQARDVTQVVADVASRVASARTAIAQLRDLLNRAGTVGGLLSVQDQINAEEASLEALQSQQRALAGETTFATISMTIVGTTAARAHHHRRATGPAGFVGGLAAGWRAFADGVAWLLTGAGAALPFLALIALAALAGYAARRRLVRRKAAGASPAH